MCELCSRGGASLIQNPNSHKTHKSDFLSQIWCCGEFLVLAVGECVDGRVRSCFSAYEQFAAYFDPLARVGLYSMVKRLMLRNNWNL